MSKNDKAKEKVKRIMSVINSALSEMELGSSLRADVMIASLAPLLWLELDQPLLPPQIQIASPRKESIPITEKSIEQAILRWKRAPCLHHPDTNLAPRDSSLDCVECRDLLKKMILSP